MIFFLEVIDREDSPKPAGKLGKKKVDASEAENDQKMDNETMAEEKLVAKEHVHYIPPVLNAVIKFGYDRGVMELFHNDENAFDNHFYAMLTHAQAHYSDGSLGFILRLQVKYLIRVFLVALQKSINLSQFFVTIILNNGRIPSYRFLILISTSLMHIGLHVIFQLQKMSSANTI